MTAPPHRPFRWAIALGAGLLITLPTACSGSERGPAERHTRSSAGATAATKKDGHLTFTVLFLRCGLGAVAGTHAEGTPEGEYCQTRLRVANNDPESHTYVAGRQLLAGVEGRYARPSRFAMAVRRQLDEVPIGAHDLIEVEVWYDVPKGARVTGVKVGGDRDQMGFLDTSTVPYVRGGAFIPVTPERLAPTTPTSISTSRLSATPG